jgi:hypothetical protein
MLFTQLFPKLSDGFCIAGVLADGTPYAAIVELPVTKTLTLFNNADQFIQNNCKTCEFYQKNQPKDFDIGPQEVLYRKGENTVCLASKPIRCLKNIPVLTKEDVEVKLPPLALFYNAREVNDFLTSPRKFPTRASGHFELFDVNLDAILKQRVLEMMSFHGCNVWPSGKICWGSNPTPKSLRQAHDVFWHSILNLDLSRGSGSLRQSLQSYVPTPYSSSYEGSRHISLRKTGSRLVRGNFSGCIVASGADKEYWVSQLPIPKQKEANEKPFIVAFFRNLPYGQKGSIIEISGEYILKNTANPFTTKGKTTFLFSAEDTFSSMGF